MFVCLFFAANAYPPSKFRAVPYIRHCAFPNRICACRLSVCPAMLEEGGQASRVRTALHARRWADPA